MLVSPITSRRQQLKLSRGELAVLLEVSRTMISLYERGECLPTANALMRLGKALHRDEQKLATELTEFQSAVRAQLETRVTNVAASVA